ncbi:hypothetical protein ACFWC5_16405 [Streptomyces sp. NPDC060085]|uniref:hypothetical protein n=1 Tax=Streptomyces sp. NPDC060085 TaxID=3347054 RepID=UPI00365B7EF5
MPVYEYHPDELARLDVVRRARGLSLSRVREYWRAAQDREGRARHAPAEPRKPSELDIASCQRLEWARIVRVMEEQRMAVYLPDEDRRVARREELRVQRMAAEAALDEHSGEGLPAEVLRYRVYRITAQPVASVRDQLLIRHVFALSEGAAVEHAQAMFSRPAGIYQDCGYRIISVDQVLPEPGAFP